mgnify:CR=1 FL=1
MARTGTPFLDNLVNNAATSLNTGTYPNPINYGDGINLSGNLTSNTDGSFEG